MRHGDRQHWAMHPRAPVVEIEALNATLLTPGLRIEPIAARHAASLFDGMCDPALYEWISMKPPASVERLATRWGRHAALLHTQADPFWLAWAVQRTGDGAWIGELDAEVRADGIATNVGYFFLPAYWGRGHASEAVRTLCDHFARCGVVEQRATVTVGHRASERVLERAGFVRTRILPNNEVLRGVPHDDIEFVRRD
jgi:RimJ/RimL family protein N-acetyltransferase